jgi:hypothetical protein
MKRLVAVLVVASAATVGGVVTAGAASADICLNADITVNGQNQQINECIPTTPPALPALPGL